MLGLLLVAFGEPASAATLEKADFAFVNVADTTQGFLFFGDMPAINNAGAVAFNAIGPSFLTGAVFKGDNNTLTTIASSAGGVLNNLVAGGITPGGVVSFFARVTNGNGDAIIAAGTGGNINTIIDANQQGLVGPLMNNDAMNTSGTVASTAFRTGFRSQVIVAADGGALKVLIDTKTSNFIALGNAAINASEAIVFRGFLADGTEGLFTGPNGSRVVADTNNPNFAGFLDPVINNAGTIASAAFLSNGGSEVFSDSGTGVTPRTDPSSPFFTLVDNVTINNSGDVAFFANEVTGRNGIFLETTGGASPVPVIESGDPLFGSIVARVNIGRFSLNDHDQISMQYTLADGRSGIAIAYPKYGQRQ
jgi:hypothetical protein